MPLHDCSSRARPGAWLLWAALMGLLLVLAPAPGYAEDDKGDEPAKPNESEQDEVEKYEPLLPKALLNPKAFKELVEAARRYFDLDEELWVGRKALVKILEEMASKGEYPLKDMPFLRWLVAQSRTFEPEMKDRKWQREQGIREAKSLAGTLYRIKSERLTVTFSLPRKYPKLKKMRTQYPRIDPYPLLLTMHERRDFSGKKYPGENLMKRRFPKDVWGDLYKQWIVLAPEAAAGVFVDPNGLVRQSVFREPFSMFWKHYHIDFERVILDGTEQALSVAASMPVFFAGIVFRGKWKLETDEQKETVHNFAPIPVYVVDNPELAQQLRDAGHPNVTAGISGPILLKWMGEQRRALPKKFKWTAQLDNQVLPYWINLGTVKWGDPRREIEVEVVDTEAEPNTIKIKAHGISQMALFLNDDIVDLDRPVNVVINEHVEFAELIEPTREQLKRIGRDLDLMFNREPVRIRKSMFFGWLRSARVVNLNVRPPPKKKEPVKAEPAKDPGPAATPEQERRAERYMKKAEFFLTKGDTDEAIKYLKLVLDLPKNKQSVDAKKKLEELEGK